jgi:ribose 5-phosphate isomerase B
MGRFVNIFYEKHYNEYMVLYIGADHRGYELKEGLKRFLSEKGYQVEDCGNLRREEGDAYPVFARAVAQKVISNYVNSRGILICGSGAGMEIAANKFKSIRASVVMNPNHAFDVRNDDDTNVLVLAADYTPLETAKKILVTWLETPFSHEPKHAERIQHIDRIEEETMKDVG